MPVVTADWGSSCGRFGGCGACEMQHSVHQGQFENASIVRAAVFILLRARFRWAHLSAVAGEYVNTMLAYSNVERTGHCVLPHSSGCLGSSQPSQHRHNIWMQVRVEKLLQDTS